jgi:hypothetical protein
MSNQSPEIKPEEFGLSRFKRIASGSKSLLDTILGKLISRKLLTFITATVLISQQTLESGDWTLIACIYIGVQGAIDFYKVRNGVST